MKRHVVLVLFLACALAACGKKRVVTQPELPPLQPPPPPERVIAPPEPAATVGAEPQNPPEAQKTPRNTSGGRPKPAVTEPPKPVELPPPAVPPTVVGQPLQTPEAQTQENEANRLLEQAKSDRAKVPTGLKGDAKEQFDTAVRFMEQADQALKDKNPSLALRLAKNAATIMAALANR
jgi:uncharacterized protein YukE